jgi:hypothetical protein
VALQVVVETDPEQREQQHALSGAEVAAVDTGAEDAGEQARTDAGPCGSTPAGQAPGEERLGDHQHDRHAYQHRDDGVERRRRQRQQQHRAEHRAGPRDDREPHHAATPAGQLTTVPERAGQRARHQTQAVGHVGGQRRVAQREQDRERHQCSGADDRVDHSCPHGGDDDGHRVPDAHPVLPSGTRAG